MEEVTSFTEHRMHNAQRTTDNARGSARKREEWRAGRERGSRFEAEEVLDGVFQTLFEDGFELSQILITVGTIYCVPTWRYDQGPSDLLEVHYHVGISRLSAPLSVSLPLSTRRYLLATDYPSCFG